MLRILLFSAKEDLKYQAWKIFNDHYHSDATSRTTINFRLKNLRKIVRDGWIRFFLKSLKISESPCKRVCSFTTSLTTHHILDPYWFAFYDLRGFSYQKFWCNTLYYSDIIPLRFRKAGRVWFGGARKTHWATRHYRETPSKTKEFLKSSCFLRSKW